MMGSTTLTSPISEQQRLSSKERDRRNLNPTAEAYIAMNLWSDEYAFKQRGGSMDFWDSLDESRKQRCRYLAQRVREADKAHGVKLPNGERS